MMKFVIDLLLFSILHCYIVSSDYLRCSSQCPQITISFLDPLRLPIECAEEKIFDWALICLIDYRIDYDAQSIYLNFKATNDTKTFQTYNQSEHLIQSIWLGFQGEIDQPNITHRHYACNTANDCAREFYLGTIQRLINKGKILLEKIRWKLIRQSQEENSTTLRCIDSRKRGNRTAVPCSQGSCSLHHIDYQWKQRPTVHKQKCQQDSQATFFSEIEFYSPHLDQHGLQLIEYKCQRKFCNRNEIFQRIRTIVIDYTRWKSADELQVKTSSLSAFSASLSLVFLMFFLIK